VPGFAERVTALKPQLDLDRVFADAIRGRPVVLGYVFLPVVPKGEDTVRGQLGPPLFDKSTASQYAADYRTPLGAIGNLPVLQSATTYGGFFDHPTIDDDGVIRDVPLMQVFEGQAYPSLALSVARVAAGNPEVTMEFEPPEARGGLNLERVRLGPYVAPVDRDVTVMVPYRGRERSFPYVPATDVLNGKADPAVLKDAIAFLGTTAAGLKDLRTAPVGQAYPGVEVHANVVSGLLDGSLRQRAPYYLGMETTLLLLIGLLLAWILPNFSPLVSSVVVAGLIAAVAGLAMWLWSGARLVFPLGVPIVFTLTVYLVQLLYGYFVETRRSRDISKRFGEYVPPEIVEEMAANPSVATMKGDVREMTVLFSDVRGFTSISEKLDAAELSELMNQFLTPLTRVIHKHRGTIDKYMGDAIMAFWGAPLPDPEHAHHALTASLDMVRALKELHEPFEKRGWPKLQIGVGLTTGVMRVGDMGSEYRKAYTVMGDPVNLGSRVEGLTKEYGVWIICTEFTRNAGPSDWSYRELDSVKVKGKDEPVAIYEPMGPKDALAADLRQDLARHRGALKMYREQQWDKAEQEFFSLSRGAHPHPVYEMFLERIAHFRKNPPGEKWDGVWTFKTK